MRCWCCRGDAELPARRLKHQARRATSRNLLTAGAYALLYNVIGYPAGVVPITRVRPGEESSRTASRDVIERTARTVEMGSAGPPIGVQVVARPWREHVALAAMRAIEAVASTREDSPRTPSIVAG